MEVSTILADYVSLQRRAQVRTAAMSADAGSHHFSVMKNLITDETRFLVAEQCGFYELQR